MNKLKNIFKKIKNYFNSLSFKNVILLIVGAIFIVIVINIVISLQSTNAPVLTVNDETQTITNQAGLVVSHYEYFDNVQSKSAGNFLVIYVDNMSTITGQEIRSLITKVLQKKGLKERDVSITIKQMDDSATAGFDFNNEDQFDPTDPSTFIGKSSEELRIKYDAEPIVGITFSQFVDTNPSTENYDIERDSANSYTVILKNGYTEALFKSEVLSKFTEADAAQITFVDIFKYKEVAN